MSTKKDTGRFIVAGLALALLAPLTLAGKPGGGGGGGSTPPADPAISCIRQSSKGSTTTRALQVMNADGTNVRTLVSGASTDMSGADWSPDGTQLAFMYDGSQGPGVYVVNVDGTGLHHVTSVSALFSGWAHRQPAWSPTTTPDGSTKIAFIDNPSSGMSAAVFVVNLDGSGRAQLTPSIAVPTNGMGAWWTVTWSPGADAIAHGTYTAQDGSVRDVLVHDVGVAGGALVVTSTLNLTDAASVPGGTLNALHVGRPSWSRDGSRIAVDAEYETWVIDLDDPASPTNVSPSGFSDMQASCWSPDDTKLVVTQWSNGRDVLTMNADGTNPVRIAGSSRTTQYFNPTWRRNQ